MFEEKEFQIRGTTPLMMHNIQLANPLNAFAKEMKKISGKRKKTDEDYEALARIEFMGGLYRDGDGNYVIKAEAWEAALIDAAKTMKKGKVAKAGVIVRDDAKLKYAGPTDPEKRFSDEACVDYRAVRVQQARTMRCRPLFRDWSCKLAVQYDPRQLDAADLRSWLEIAGRQIGILEYRPKFGLFEVL